MTPDPLIAALTRRRKDRTMHQAHLADLAGISRAQIIRIETGMCSPTLFSLRRLADALGLELTITPKGQP